MLFKKKTEEPKTPQLLGEDFDIYPDLGIRPTPAVPDTASEPEPEEPEEPELTPFQQRVAAMDEKKWNRLQILGGIALSAAALFSLYFKPFQRYGLAVAALLLLLGPNLLERKAKRSIRRGRTALLITFALGLLLYLGYTLIWHPEAFQPAAS